VSHSSCQVQCHAQNSRRPRQLRESKLLELGFVALPPQPRGTRCFCPLTLRRHIAALALCSNRLRSQVCRGVGFPWSHCVPAQQRRHDCARVIQRLHARGARCNWDTQPPAHRHRQSLRSHNGLRVSQRCAAHCLLVAIPVAVVLVTLRHSLFAPAVQRSVLVAELLQAING
jgi:hypothetical protein